MSAKNHTRLNPRQRLTRGLTYTAVGPVDVTRGIVGLGAHSAQAGASSLRRRYREGRLARELHTAETILAPELAGAQKVVTRLRQGRRPQGRGKRPWLIGGVAVAVLAGGAAAFSIVRRSTRHEPSPRPPSVDVQPRP